MTNDQILLVLAGALFLWMISRQFLGKVAPAKARELVAQGARLVDVRTPAEFAGGHLQGAINVPLQELGGRLHELGDKEKPVVVYCQSGMRSASAVSHLKRSGFREVHDLGAMGRWG